jgi:four helix bundle protein
MRTTEQPTALALVMAILPRVKRIIDAIRAHDRNLADQIKRAITSVALNLGEADGSDPGNRRARLHTALGSLKETRRGLEIATAWTYVSASDVAPIERELDSATAMTWRRLHPR